MTRSKNAPEIQTTSKLARTKSPWGTTHTHTRTSPSISREGVNIHQQHLATRQQAATRKSLGYTHTDTHARLACLTKAHMFVLHTHTIQNVNQHTHIQTNTNGRPDVSPPRPVRQNKRPSHLPCLLQLQTQNQRPPPPHTHTRPERQRLQQRLQQRCANEQRGCVPSAQEPPSLRSPPSLSSFSLLL